MKGTNFFQEGILKGSNKNGGENVSQEFRLKNILEIKNYFIKKIDRNKLISKKHKKISAKS